MNQGVRAGSTRRTAIAAGLVLALAGRAAAQTAAKPRVAVLSWYSTADAAMLKAMVEELARLGWIDGQTLTLEFHWAASDRARADEVIE